MTQARVRLGVICTVGPLRFMPFLGQFRRDYPGIALTVTEHAPEELIAPLLAGAIDVAVTSQPGPLPDRIEARPIYRERFTVALPPGHPLAGETSVPLERIDGEDYVDRINCEYGDYIGGLMAARGIAVNVVFQSAREEWVQMMIMSGAGIA